MTSAGVNAERTLIVRGDLFSDTGYARATRALASLMRPHVDRLLGVSLHTHATRRANSFDFPVIDDDEAAAQCGLGPAAVVNITTPENFYPIRGACNIGYFFWETEKLPTNLSWLGPMRLMDRLWAPSTWQRDLMGALTGRDTPVIAWPQTLPSTTNVNHRALLENVRAHPAMTLAQARNYHLRIQPPGVNSLEKDAEERDFQNGWSDRFDPGASPLLDDIAATEGDAFLCIQTDAVRKGLPVLLASWMAFRKTPEGAKAKLIIKLSTIDVYADFFRVHFLASLAHNAAARRAGIVETGVWFVNERMSEEQIQALFFSCDAYCTATYGEGFGGPIAEALLLGKPVLSPTHTSIIDLLGAEYALAIDSAPHVLALWRNIPIYSPSTVWHIPSDASFTATLCRFSRMTRQERQALAAKAQEGLLARTGAQKVNAVLKQEFDDIFANSRKI